MVHAIPSRQVCSGFHPQGTEGYVSISPMAYGKPIPCHLLRRHTLTPPRVFRPPAELALMKNPSRSTIMRAQLVRISYGPQVWLQRQVERHRRHHPPANRKTGSYSFARVRRRRGQVRSGGQQSRPGRPPPWDPGDRWLLGWGDPHPGSTAEAGQIPSPAIPRHVVTCYNRHRGKTRTQPQGQVWSRSTAIASMQ